MDNPEVNIKNERYIGFLEYLNIPFDNILLVFLKGEGDSEFLKNSIRAKIIIDIDITIIIIPKFRNSPELMCIFLIKNNSSIPPIITGEKNKNGGTLNIL